jgi:sugar-specific transcriptional regulator TrmB
MLDQHLVSVFIQLGLSESESSVYAASLALGPATAIELAEKSDIKRTTVYTVVDSLLNKGLMTVEIKGLKRKFVAEHPSQLETVLESRKDLLSNTLKRYESVFAKRKGDSSIRYYQGLVGMKTAYTDLLRQLRPKDFYYAISNHKQWYGTDPKFFQSFIEERIPLRITTKLLLVDSKETREMKRFERNFEQNIKLLPPTIPLTTTSIVTPRRVMIHQLVQPIMVIVIENQNIIQMQKETFDLLWATTS